MSTLAARYRALPRAARWALAAVLFVAAYFLIVEPTLDASAHLSARADAAQASLDRAARRSSGQSEVGQRLALAAARFGPALPPGRDAAERSAQLNSRLETIFRAHRVEALSIKSRAQTPLGRAAFPGLLAESEQVVRLILDVDFEASPRATAQIIAALESAPEVAQLGRVILRSVERDGVERLQASLSPEAWAIAPRGNAR